MAPIKARSQSGGGIGKKVHRKARPTHREASDSWEILERQGLNGTSNEEAVDDVDHALAIESSNDVDEAVDPLREVAEKVGRDVEAFAETLDRFLSDLPTVSSRFDAAHDLVLQFRAIADDTVEDLKKTHEREMREQLKKEWSEQAHISAASTSLKPFTSSGSSSISAKKAEQVKELRQWQQEADIWELFRIMLDLHPFEADAQAMQTEKEDKLVKLGPPHRYMSEGDLWERFLLEDDLAKERHVIKIWLEQTAGHQASDVQGIVEELEAKAGRGKGLWSSGWMHTRERIKGEKRLRTWPDAADSPLPQIKRSDNNEMLATTLDPDAPYRQKRTLEKQDAYFERAIWVACWEMLRRGTPLLETCDWCEERKEGWRALIMGGALDHSDSESSHTAWRQICLLASQSGCTTDYEAAVLGLLGGNVKAMQKVSHTIDDHLYAYYSATLTRQFEQYLLSANFGKAPSPKMRRSAADDSMDPERAQQAISDLISKLRQGSATSSESAQPMKIIQSFLLADEVGSLIHTVGVAISETATLHGPEDMVFLRDRTAPDHGQPRAEAEVAFNLQTLRITTHMAVIHRILSPDHLEGDELLEDENLLVAYVQKLREAEKRLLIPTYAAQMSPQRYIIVLGRILQDVTDHHEQNDMLGLMRELDLDVVTILQEQVSYILDTTFDESWAEHPLPMIESTTETKVHPGMRIKNGFLSDQFTESDEALVRALQWFQLLEGHWEVTFKSLTHVLRKCLVTGHVTAARLIVSKIPFEDLSIRKSYETIGRAINVMDESAAIPVDENERMALNLMRRQSRTYFELEQMILALEALSNWRAEEIKYVGLTSKPARMPHIFRGLKQAVSEAMEPILHGILMNPIDEREARELAYIRVKYLPEMVLGYNAVLHASGNMQTRDALLESMDLSTIIANNTAPPNHDGDQIGGDGKGNGLAEVFVQAGRMRELVNAFAYTSKAMLVLKAEGRPWKVKKSDRLQKDLGMWEINGGGGNESD